MSTNERVRVHPDRDSWSLRFRGDEPGCRSVAVLRDTFVWGPMVSTLPGHTHNLQTRNNPNEGNQLEEDDEEPSCC